MAYDGDEMLVYNGVPCTRDVLFHKVKKNGWTKALFGPMEQAQINQILAGNLTPAAMGLSVAKVFKPSDSAKLPDLQDEDTTSSIMAKPGFEPAPTEQPTQLSGVKLGDPELGLAIVGITPPSQVVAVAKAKEALSEQGDGKFLRPVDPSKGPGAPAPMQQQPQNTPAQPQGYQPQYQQPPQQAPRMANVRPPRTDKDKLQSMLEAAFELAKNEATVGTAKTLIKTNGLERAFTVMYPDLVRKVLGNIDTTPDVKCRGGIVFDIEAEPNDGYIHIITSAGVITVTGQNLALKGADL